MTVTEKRKSMKQIGWRSSAINTPGARAREKARGKHNSAWFAVAQLRTNTEAAVLAEAVVGAGDSEM